MKKQFLPYLLLIVTLFSCSSDDNQLNDTPQEPISSELSVNLDQVISNSLSVQLKATVTNDSENVAEYGFLVAQSDDLLFYEILTSRHIARKFNNQNPPTNEEGKYYEFLGSNSSLGHYQGYLTDDIFEEYVQLEELSTENLNFARAYIKTVTDSIIYSNVIEFEKPKGWQKYPSELPSSLSILRLLGEQSVFTHDNFIYSIGSANGLRAVLRMSINSGIWEVYSNIPDSIYSGLGGDSFYLTIGSYYDNGKIIFLIFDQSFPSVYIYDIDNDIWTTKNDFNNFPLAYAEVSFTLNNIPYVGGRSSSNNEFKIFKYSISDDVWSEITDVPTIVPTNPMTFISNNKFYILGRNDPNISSDVAEALFFYLPETNNWVKEYRLDNQFSSNNSVFVQDEIAYLIGTRLESNDQSYPYVINTSNNSDSNKTSFLVPLLNSYDPAPILGRYHHRRISAKFGNRIILGLGEDNGDNQNQTNVYNELYYCDFVENIYSE